MLGAIRQRWATSSGWLGRTGSAARLVEPASPRNGRMRTISFLGQNWIARERRDEERPGGQAKRSRSGRSPRGTTKNTSRGDVGLHGGETTGALPLPFVYNALTEGSSAGASSSL